MFGELILIKYYDFLLCPVTRVVPHRHVAGHAGDTRPRKQSLQQLHYGDRTASLKYTKMVPEVGPSDGCPPRGLN